PTGLARREGVQFPCDLPRLGPSVLRLAREKRCAVHTHFKLPRCSPDQRYAFQSVATFPDYFVRQPDGARPVVSLLAINNLDFHFLCLPEIHYSHFLWVAQPVPDGLP